MPLDEDGPQHEDSRINPVHTMTVMPEDGPIRGNGFWADDTVHMSLQCATQWDALSHVGYDGYLYNGFPSSSITKNTGATRNGIHNASAHLIGRGVLLDIPRLKEVSMLPEGYEITIRDLEDATMAQKVEISTGDILLIRTGWYQQFELGKRSRYMQAPIPGVGISVCEWLHANQIAALASDTNAVEVLPSKVDGVELPVHMLLIRDMGMMLGEMFNLEELALDCDRDGRWAFFLSALPLKFTNAVGSPLSPVAIK
jgi:kynurenine formamidase